MLIIRETGGKEKSVGIQRNSLYCMLVFCKPKTALKINLNLKIIKAKIPSQRRKMKSILSEKQGGSC